MEEEWRRIGYREYQASSLGNIRGPRGHVLHPWLAGPQNARYLYVCLGKGKKGRLHRFVAMAFLPNPLNLPEINHKDGNKNNNAVSNLEWCTGSYNKRHAYLHGLRDWHKAVFAMNMARRMATDASHT